MKKVKMVLYGEPGVGKSVFASKAPNPFFITTDGNYEWLSEFGAKEEDHVQVSTWAEAKKVFAKLGDAEYDKYDTVVLDLTEDTFKWCEQEYCKKNSFDHVSEAGYGKGYDITRNDFFIEICRIIGLDKHVILIMHGLNVVTKDRRGVEQYKYVPSNRIPDKVLDMIEGRVRYFLRAYVKAEEINGQLIKKRYLSLIPKENEYGIIRGIDENNVPSDIPLDWDTFASVIGLDSAKSNKAVETPKKKAVEKPVEKSAEPEPKEVETPKEAEQPKVDEKPVNLKSKRVKKEIMDSMYEDPSGNEEDSPFEVPEEFRKPQPAPEPTPAPTPNKPLTKEEKLAALKARIEANKKRSN